MGTFQTLHYRNHPNGYRSSINHLLILYSGYTRRNSYYTRNRNRMGFLHNQLRDSYSRYIPHVHLHKSPESSANRNRDVETQLWHIPHAYILARVVGNRIQDYIGTAYCCRHTMHRSEYIRLLPHNYKDYLVYTGQQMDNRINICLICIA